MVKSRGYRKKERNSFKRARRPIIFFVAEGKNYTETHYFTDFAKDKNRNIRFAPGNFTDPENMVKGLGEYLIEKDFNNDIGDKAYCLIDADVDVSKNKQIAKAIRLANSRGIEVILSVPCFEVWFISHFAYSTKKYTSNDEVVDELQKYIPGYDKNTKGVYNLTKSKVSIAVENAYRLEQECLSNGYKKYTVDFLPSSEVYKIVGELNREAL